MKTVELKSILEGKNYPDAGDDLFTIIDDSIATSDKVMIDMMDVVSIPTMFMNTSFGAIIDKYSVDLLKKSIGFKNITKLQLERIKKYLSDYEQVANMKI